MKTTHERQSTKFHEIILFATADSIDCQYRKILTKSNWMIIELLSKIWEQRM